LGNFVFDEFDGEVVTEVVKEGRGGVQGGHGRGRGNSGKVGGVGGGGGRWMM